MKIKHVFLPLICFALSACIGTGPDSNATVIHFIGVHDTYSQAAMNELINNYNEGQGKEDGVFVNATWSNGDYGQYSSTLARSTRYSVVTVSVGQLKQLGVSDYLLQLDTDDLLTPERKAKIDYDQISDELLNPYRFNGKNKNTDGKYEAGYGQPLRGIPYGVSPFVLFYNSLIFKNAGINIVSVAEDKIEAYNTEHGTNLMPHGYAEYKNSPFSGAISSQNLDNKMVYKVFNNAIAMNWEEARILSYSFQIQRGMNYGYMSEWWFNYGFSVGGDCIGWSDQKKEYEFTIGDKSDNWLAIDNLVVNNTEYKKGEVLYHEDAAYVNAGNASSAVTSKLHVMPSQYDAFLESNRLGVPRNKSAETGLNGYGVSPNTTTSRSARFLTGSDCPLLIESYSNVNPFKSSLKENFDIALSPQYREFVGGSVVGNASDITTQRLKVIGETYGDVVYNGELVKAENGTPIVGEIQNVGTSNALCIPVNSDPSKYQASMDFISWVCSSEGQLQIAKSNSYIPTLGNVALSDDFLNSDDRKVQNTYAASLASRNMDIGDYHYFQTKTWIDSWASLLNVDVRNGTCTLTSFLEQKKTEADNALATMTLRVYGR